MNIKIALLSATLSSTLLLSQTAVAYNDDYPNWYAGAHLGSLKTELTQGEQDFSFTAINVSLGYRFHPYMAAEFLGVFTTDSKRDEYVSADVSAGNNTSVSVDADSSAIGLYFVAQTPGQFYGKARIGLAESRFEYSASGFQTEKEGKLGLSYGLGAGFQIDNIRIEADYVVLPEVDDPLYNNTSYESASFTIGFNYEF